jgi:plastocyanin
MRPVRRAAGAAAIVGTAAIVAACGGAQQGTKDQADAVRNAETAASANTRDLPGSPAPDTTVAGAETAPSTTAATPSGNTTSTAAGARTVTAESGAGQTQEVTISAAPTGLRFATTRVVAKAGTIELTMANPSAIPHNIAVDRPEHEVGDTVRRGGSSHIALDFPPGTYQYYCAVPGHRQAGMVGTLVVR